MFLTVSKFVDVIKKNPWVTLFFTGWGLYFVCFWINVVTVHENGAVSVGLVTVWGDWAIHFTMGSVMAFREWLPHSSPLLLDAHFSYPFVVNMLSAALVRINVPFFTAFTLPSFIFSLTLLISIFAFYRLVLCRSGLAMLGVLLYFFNGGTGVFELFSDLAASVNPMDLLINPPRLYTKMPDLHIEWMSVLYSMVVPQRAFPLGASICIGSLALIFYSFQLLRHKTRAPILWVSISVGVLLGFLPIIHTHSFLAAFIILGFWCLSDFVRVDVSRLKQNIIHWLIIAAVTAIIALPIIYVYFLSNLSNSSFFRWYPGWYANEYDVNWFVFWFKNWTFVPFLATWGMVVFVKRGQGSKERWARLLLVMPGAVLFAIPNLFLTQPWIWDNTKLIVWSSLFYSPLAVYGSAHLFSSSGVVFRIFQSFFFAVTHLLYVCREKYKKHSRNVDKAAGLTLNDTQPLPQTFQKTIDRVCHGVCRTAWVAILVFMCSSGALDAYNVVRTDLHTHTMYDAHEVKLAEWVKNNTSPNSIWLTSAKHNHWLFNLTGRQAVMTYPGWLWTHGYDYGEVEKDVGAMFRTGDRETLKKYRVDYIVLDYSAKKKLKASEAVLLKNFKIVKKSSQYTIFSVPKT
jgi:hypothetical protein